MLNDEELKDFFFEAALATYAGGAAKTTIPDLPGSKVLRHERGPYMYVDTYFVNGIVSCGQTLIWCANVPLWFMQYHGFCHDKLASELVKKAMRAAYQERLFLGGRGIDIEEGNLKYHNEAMQSCYKFHGSEYVVQADSIIFWHGYHGGLLEKT